MRFGALATMLATALAASAGALPPDFLPSSQIKRGMKGYGLSVFTGTQPERFEVEIIGVLENAFPKQNMVLARMKGAGLEKTGIVAGMSGSPIYLEVDGKFKLAGAVAYGWSFPKEPVCGITPAENMYEVLASAPPPKKAGGPPEKAAARLDAPIELEGRTFKSVRVAAGPAWEGATADAAMLYRIRTPLTVAGLTPAALDLLRRDLEPLGFLPVQGGAASGADAQEAKLVPGAALAVRMADGDIVMDGVGTCTAVLGDKVLAFGHPMFGEGEVSVPMATAVVHLSYPSLFRSFKLASGAKIVGRLVADEQSGIMGKIGEFARMIPVEVKFHRSDVQGESTYHCRVFEHPRLTPLLIGLFLLNFMTVHGDLPEENTLRFHATIRLKGREPIAVENVYSGLESARALLEALNDITARVQLLGDNPFGEVVIEGIDADLTILAQETTSRIEAVRLDRNDYRAGDTVRALVTIKPTKGEAVLRTLELKLPDDLPEGETEIMVCDAPTSFKLDHSEAAYRYRPDDLDHLVAILREEEPQRQRVYIRLKLPDRGVALGASELPSLPQSMLNLVASPKTTGLSATGKSIKAFVATDYVVSGAHALSILVRPRETP